MKTKFLKILPFFLSFSLGMAEETSSTKTTKIEDQRFIQYNNRAVMFIPFHQSYERIKPSAFYAGIDAFLVGSNRKHVLLNTELRSGYNFFFNQQDHLTPFVGAGYLEDFYWDDPHHFKLRHKPGIAYGTIGFLYTHEFTSVFNLGLNSKVLLGAPVSTSHFDWGSFIVGNEVSIPITFRFGHGRHWDFRLEPFNLYLHGSKASRDYKGTIITLGYRF